MNILLHCSGMPFNGNTIKHSSLGGSETSAYYLAKNLVKQGNRVIMFTNCADEDAGEFDGVTYLPCGKTTQDMPLGTQFHAYAMNTPHDVCIIQRHPLAFNYQWASKVNIWWVHDLATVSLKQTAVQHLWNINAIWCVSEYHKKQYKEVYNINPEIIHVVRNGVDSEVIKAIRDEAIDIGTGSGIDKTIFEVADKKLMLYSSRPERGLEHLVAPNGIMERLGDDYMLLVCNYDNATPRTEKYYNYLYSRCEELSNVKMLGHLSKSDLYKAMLYSSVLAYPTEFEEVSCITAMEAMQCALPMLTTKTAALPETCRGAGVKFIKDTEGGAALVTEFTKQVKSFLSNDLQLEKLRDKQLKAGEYFSWHNVIKDYVNSINSLFKDKSQEAIINHCIEHSDIYALKDYIQGKKLSKYSEFIVNKHLPLYNFSNSVDDMEKHYNEYYKNHGEPLSKQDPTASGRFNYTASLLGGLSDNANVIDYGCGHGHNIIYFAKQYPEYNFIGIDISDENIKFAKEWAEEAGVKNITFYHADIMQGFNASFWKELPLADAVICAEVIEHVTDYLELINRLTLILKFKGRFIATTPYGRWEWQSFNEYDKYRFHLHHFEYSDIEDIIGGCKEKFISNVPVGNDQGGRLLGSYVWGFTNSPTNTLLHVDYKRKFKELMPRQLCSLNMIVYNAEDTIAKAIKSALPFVDEVVIGIDKNTNDNTAIQVSRLKSSLGIPFNVSYIDSPLNTGFSVARNKVLERSLLDWVLWIDADEVVHAGSNTNKLLRNNEFNGYAVKQHHFSIDPLGVLKTDLPLRIFRNHKGIKFHGLIHEHPEIKINDGAGYAQLIESLTIAHHSYHDNDTRRSKFERNIELMARDREVNPERKLGKMLWVRDLFQMNQYELEFNGGRVNNNIIVRANEAVRMWRELLKQKDTRLVLDSLPYYSQCVDMLGKDFEMSFAIGTAKDTGSNEKIKNITSSFANKQDAYDFIQLMFDENYMNYDSKYYY